MAQRKVFEDSVTPLPEEPGPKPGGLIVQATEPEHRDEEMTVQFSLAIPPDDAADLEARVARGEVVPDDQLQKRYTPDAQEREKLVRWLDAQNFKMVEVSSDGTGIYARASVDQLEKSLQVDMARVIKDGITYTAARNAPSLPADIGKTVHAVIGLQPFQTTKHSRKCTPQNGNTMTLANDVGTRNAKRTVAAPAGTKQSARIANTPPYLVSEILTAYGAQNLNGTGKGQTIAVLIQSLPDASDLQAFWKANNLPGSISCVESINVNGRHLPPAQGEEMLDVAWASSIAPGATVRVYASGTLAFVDLDRALDRIIADLPAHPGMRQLSIGLKFSERLMGGPNGEVRTQHAKFLRLAALGVNVFVSSGVPRSTPDAAGQDASGPTQAEDESCDPCAVSVGGTANEAGAGSSGGQSIFFTRPAGQNGSINAEGQERLVPDVSLAADPDTGTYLVLNGKPVQISGRSWSAPVWAGFCALMNEARGKAGKAFLPFLNPLNYPPSGTESLRGITASTSDNCTAESGYDPVTGIGVPNVGQLPSTLVVLN
jgi:kumamolisin